MGTGKRPQKRQRGRVMAKKRFFEYVGDAVLTRGDYGVAVSGGHDDGDGYIRVFDPDFGDME